MDILMTPAFAEKAERLLGEGDWGVIEKIALRPDAGKLIRGGAGPRKIRVPLPGRGKRGGARVIYFWKRAEVLFLLDIYAKNEKENLSPADLAALVQAIEEW